MFQPAARQVPRPVTGHVRRHNDMDGFGTCRPNVQVFPLQQRGHRPADVEGEGVILRAEEEHETIRRVLANFGGEPLRGQLRVANRQHVAEIVPPTRRDETEGRGPCPLDWSMR